MVSPPSTFPISHDHLSCLPKPLPSVSVLKLSGLQKTTNIHDKIRYTKIKQNPHIDTGQDDPVGGKNEKAKGSNTVTYFECKVFVQHCKNC